MRDISREISHYKLKFQSSCPSLNSNQECSRPGGCACAKFAEIHGLIHSLIKPEYRNANFRWFDGKVRNIGSTEIVQTLSQDVTSLCKNVRMQLANYLYGDYQLVAKNIRELKMGEDEYGRWICNRNLLNNFSVLDERFLKGENVIICGDPYKTQKDGVRFIPTKIPQGKTLLASIIMIDAIHRKAFSSNKAKSYEWISFLQLRQKMKSKDSEKNDLEDFQYADWLVIDDIDLIVQNNMSKSDLWTKEVFDSFLMERIEHRLPTILVCDFDIGKESLKDKMGAAFEKIVTASNTCRIKV
jgi:hypothetical protein